MINITYLPQRHNVLAADPCRATLDAAEDNKAFKAVLYFCGVAQQLVNLGVLDKDTRIASVSPEMLPCWWRLFGTGYKPDEYDRASFRQVCLSDGDATEESVDSFLFWYDRYIHPDFFGRRDLRPNEHN